MQPAQPSLHRNATATAALGLGLAALAAALPAAAGTATDTAAITAASPEVTMSDFHWNNRPLLVFVPHDGHPLLAAQRARLAGRDTGLADRDMVLIEAVGEDVAVDGLPAPGLDAASLRRRFGIADRDAAVILVGKDGGAKLARQNALPAAELFATIDAMPMRRREMGAAAR